MWQGSGYARQGRVVEQCEWVVHTTERSWHYGATVRVHVLLADALACCCALSAPAALSLPCCPTQFSHYFWPSVIGIVPGLIIYVWLGSLAADVTEAVAGGGVSTPPAGERVGWVVVEVALGARTQ